MKHFNQASAWYFFVQRPTNYPHNNHNPSLSPITHNKHSSVSRETFSVFESTWSFFDKYPEQQKTAFQIAEMRFLAYVAIYRNRIMWALRAIFTLFFCLLYSCVFGLIFDCSEFGSITFCYGLFLNLILLVIRYSHCNDVIVVSLHSEYVHTACGSSLT